MQSCAENVTWLIDHGIEEKDIGKCYLTKIVG